MGCGPSRQSKSARSWEAHNGTANEKRATRSARGSVGQQRSNSGRVNVTETATTKRPDEPLGEPDTDCRDLGDGQLGIASTSEIDRVYNSISPGKVFLDKGFPTKSEYLASRDRNNRSIKWLRPKQLVKSPSIFVDGIGRNDIAQGNLGDCWFLSSCAAVAAEPSLMRKVMPEGQLLHGDGYKGVVQCRFWRFGEWIHVAIDDKLPTNDDRLIYARGVDSAEFWVAMLEKAYAKIHGGYAAIEGGQSMDALVDLTGGLAERYELADHPGDALYNKLARAATSGAFITCSRKGDWRRQDQHADRMGLIAGHAYTISDVKKIKRVNGMENLIRIRNPWGMGIEWKGAWCDNDHRWNLVDDETKKWLQYETKEDGEFWINYKDFTEQFQEVTICTVGPDFDGDGDADKADSIRMIHGRWRFGTTAGGCRNDIDAFALNPQFLLTVHEADDPDNSTIGDDEENNTTKCSVVIGLMQEHRRSQRERGIKMLQIGYIIYKTNDPGQRLTKDHFMYNYETAKSGTYVNFREVCGRFDFEPGHYVIIPTTYDKNDEGTFLLRVYAAKPISLSIIDDEE